MTYKTRQSVTVSRMTQHPLVDQGTCFIVVPNHDWNGRSQVLTGNCWRGPFETKELAQREAAKWMIEHGWLSCGVFKLVGTVAKPIPDLSWHEVVETKSTDDQQQYGTPGEEH